MIRSWAQPACGEVPTRFLVVVDSADDFPPAIAGVRTLADETTYLISGDIDLQGSRLVGGVDTTIKGVGSSENCGLRSSGLIGAPLLSSQWSLPLQDLFITADLALDLDGSADPNAALDWTGVNFVDCGACGTIANYANFVASLCAWLNSGNLTFTGAFGTVAFNNCLLRPPAGQTAVIVPGAASITRRFRAIYSSIIAVGANGIDADSAAFALNESFILDTVNFSGGGTYLPGLTAVDNQALITNCTGIDNSGNAAHYYMISNGTATVIGGINTFVKVAGVTGPGAVVQKFSLSSNRATYIGALTGLFKVTAYLSMTGTGNDVITTRVALSGVTQADSTVRTTLNAAGRAESVACQTVLTLSSGAYVEVWVANQTAARNVTVTDLQVIVERLN